METLLSHSFDYLSSHDPIKIRKGLRQVEGLLAQICLSRPPQTAAEKRRSVALPTSNSSLTPSKQLSDLKDDPAFRDFFKLQESFQWNVAMRLIACLERLLGRGSNGQSDLLIISTLDLLHGILLLHPPSRSLFSRDINMNLLLDLLDPTLVPAIHSTTLLVLVAALLSNPTNTRTFEAQDGLLTVTSLFKTRAVPREVKLKLVEFLYFYLMPETSSSVGVASAPNTAVGGGGLQRRESRIAKMGLEIGAFGKRKGETIAGGVQAEHVDDKTRTTDEKQGMLARYLNNVEDLVEDLRETQPFGTVFG